MEQHLYELLRQCTVRISVPDEKGHGTGFFVAPGLILTCAHVMRTAQPSTTSVEMYWNGQLYSAQVTRFLPGSDLALLQVNLTDHPCVYLHEGATPLDTLFSYGYSDDHPHGDPATFSLEGRSGDQGEQLKFKTGQVRPGFSGAPLLNVQTGYVCGIIQLTRDRQSDLGGRAISATTVLQTFTELVDQQRRFHQLDRRWSNCLKEVVARAKYLEGVLRRYGAVALPIGSNDENFSLQAIFQPLRLRRDPLAAEDLVSETRRTLLGETSRTKDELIDAQQGSDSRKSHDPSMPTSPVVIADNGDEALKKSPQGRMVILGGPGTGKTTVLKYLMGKQARKAQADFDALIPIFISLPDLARSGKTLQEYLIRIVKDIRADDSYADMLWKAIENGQALVCLDSLDEVTPSQRAEIIRLVNELAFDLASTWIVGSRFTEYKGGQFKYGQFAEWELLPMNHVLRQELAQRLLPELCRYLHGSDKIVQLSPSEFVRVLEAHPRAAPWGENPLLFSLAAVVFVQKGELPSSRAALYHEVIEAVLKTREHEWVSQEILQSVLISLALELYRRKGRIFPLRDLVALLPEVREKQHENWKTAEMANRIIASGVLEVVAHKTYGFRHQTFQEYLTAVELARCLVSQNEATREEAWNLAWSKRNYSRWTEVLRLMVGVLTRNHGRKGVWMVQRWLQALIGQRTTSEGDPGDMGLALALKSLGEVTETSPVWKESGMVRLEREVVAIWMGELFGAVRQRRKARRDRLQALAREVSYLSVSAVDVATELLIAALSDANEAVREMAMQTLGTLGEHAPVERLVAILQDISGDMRVVAVQALGGLGRRMPIDRLVNALGDEYWGVRAAAVEVLGKLGENAPMGQLIAVLSDISGEVRAATAKVLGELGELTPVPQLMILLDDHDWLVRKEAVRALGKMRDRTPVDQLVDRLSDVNESVRAAAAQALRDLGGRIPAEQIPLERLLATLSDKDEAVREAAALALGAFMDQASVEQLVRALHNRNWEVREAAALALGGLGELAPVEPLVDALKDRNSRVRKTAAQALGKMGERAPVEQLIAALYDSEWKVREAAAQALGELGELTPVEPLLATLYYANGEMRVAALEVLGMLEEKTPIEPVITALSDSSWEIRLSSVRILGKLGERAPVEPLIAALKDRDREVREAAIWALGELGERAPVDSLVVALDSNDENVRIAAVRALGKLGERAPVEPLIAALSDHDLAVRKMASQVLGKLGERTPIELLVVTLRNHYRVGREAIHDQAVREAVTEVLEMLGEHAPVEPLVAALHDHDWLLRIAAAHALGKLGEHAPVEPLVAALHDNYWSVREAVTKALGELGEHAPVEPLVAALHDHDWPVRIAAAHALGKLGERAPVEPLVAALHDHNRQVHEAAANALKMLSGHMSVEPLVAALGDYDWQVREIVAQALGKLGERAPVEPLVITLHDHSWQVRKAAIEALEMLGERAPVGPLIAALRDGNREVRAAAVKALGKLGERAPVESLITALHDHDWQVRETAIEALEMLGERAPVEPLIAALCDYDWQVRKTAARALGKLGERVPVEPLVAALDDHSSQVRIGAIEALEMLGERAPVEPLVIALGAIDWQVRTAAVKALEMLGERVPVEPLVAALYDESFFVREAAMLALRNLKVEALMEVLGDADSYIRKLAVETLGKLGENAAVEPLKAALGDSDREVRKAAMEALQQSHRSVFSEVAPEAIAILLGQRPSKILGSLAQGFIAEIIGNMEHASYKLLEQLMQLLDWPYWEVRMKAIKALGKIRRNIPNAAIHHLLELRHDSRSRAVREAADDALAEILSLETGIEDD